MTDYQQVLNEIAEEIRPYLNKGEVASYIPPLAKIDRNKFGMAIRTVDDVEYKVGDADEKFSIQSISKAFMLAIAMDFIGENIWNKVGREPSGTAFNSLVQLETENGFPRNPFINAGAHVVSDVVMSEVEDGKQAILNLLRRESGDKTIDFDYDVANAERDTGFRNAALANFLKSYNRISNDVEAVLDTYYHQCSVSMSAVSLSRAMLFMANNGLSSTNEKPVLTPQKVKRLNAVMMTCGLYDAGGDFAFKVGLPGKSGVGGGIIVSVPNKMSIVVWSPGLDKSGSSLAGIKALELFVEKTGLSIF